MLPTFTAAIFLAAALLFALEPFAARQVLPMFGGSPAVWNTAVMFFQVELLAGYIYAHMLTRRAGPWTQVALHAALLTAAALIPFGTVASAAPASGAEVGELLWLLTRAVGLPFFAVATAGPLLQRWFGSTAHPAARDPYFLYAASNAGSFVGLLAYPFVIERLWSLPEQAALWRGGFAIFALLTVGAGVLAARRPGATLPAPARNEPTETDPNRALRDRAWWVFLAFVPSSLMLGCTQYLSTDLAAVPLLWVIPLGLYLVSFIAAFSRWSDRVTRLATRLWPIALVSVVLAFLLQARQPIIAILALHLAALLTAGCLCHGRLHACRPSVSRLTEFYLCLAVGGALGGAFNSLLAPVLFPDLYEYPLALTLACLALPLPGRAAPRRARWLWLLPPALLLWVALGPRTHVTETGDGRGLGLLLAAGAPVLVLFLLSRLPRLFTASTAALLLAVAVRSDGSHIELRERSFFGVHTVRTDAAGRFRQLAHGTTIHGLAWLDPQRRGEPLTYYHKRGPAGEAFVRLGARFGRAAFIGLGAGSLAAYAREGQRFDFYEIDPAVVRIANDPALFRFLADSRAETSFAVGDGRLLLAAATDQTYDLIVLDAFSSDAVPMHLLTREAFEVYAAKLKPDGVLLVHLSNLHLNLAPFVSAALRDLGIPALHRNDARSLEDAVEQGEYSSHWLLASRDPTALAPFRSDVQWSEPAPAARAWTDAHADLVAAFLAQ